MCKAPIFKPQFFSKRRIAAWCITLIMLGHYPNVEKSQLVNYVEDYLECVESLPLDIQRNVSLLREIDTKYQGKRNIFERCQRDMMYIYAHLHRVHLTLCGPASLQWHKTHLIKHRFQCCPRPLCFSCILSLAHPTMFVPATLSYHQWSAILTSAYSVLLFGCAPS